MAAAEDDEAGRNEKWNDLQTLALGHAWNKVSMDLASNRTSHKKDPFWELVCVAYHMSCHPALCNILMCGSFVVTKIVVRCISHVR